MCSVVKCEKGICLELSDMVWRMNFFVSVLRFYSCGFSFFADSANVFPFECFNVL